MRKIIFYKYEGAGNDFIMINNTDSSFQLSKETISKLCNRHFGVGADGLIVLEKDPNYDFKMIYYNADGSFAKMCGNGSRCAVAFAKDLKLIDKKTTFNVSNMVFKAEINNDYLTTIFMPDEAQLIFKEKDEYFFTVSQVPHLVKFSNDLTNTDIIPSARKIRYSERFGKFGGTNVNYVQKISDNHIYVRTYERGVENETLACGTGIIASSLASSIIEKLNNHNTFKVESKGGTLTISFNKNNGSFNNITMTGYSKYVFKGEIRI